jgi:hypothetical protein
MQNAKDTFYTTLRDRLAAVNPARTMVVRGATRPGVLVEENELASDAVPVDVFRLRWVELKVDASGALPLVTMSCEIRYATDGNAGNGGMDRGRLLAGMDAELAAAVSEAPRSVGKVSYSAVPPVALGTNVFWGDLAFGAVVVTDERVERVATVEVFCYQEAGEL